jgi:hypothetical protein
LSAKAGNLSLVLLKGFFHGWHIIIKRK